MSVTRSLLIARSENRARKRRSGAKIRNRKSPGPKVDDGTDDGPGGYEERDIIIVIIIIVRPFTILFYIT